MAKEPTSFPAGSPEKIDVLAARARRRLPLFHADDSLAKVAQRADEDPPFGMTE